MTENPEVQYREPKVIPQTELLPVEERGRERFRWFNWKAAAETSFGIALLAGFSIGGLWLMRMLLGMPPVEAKTWVSVGSTTAIAIAAAGLCIGVAARGQISSSES